jgi:hypothetical protein
MPPAAKACMTRMPHDGPCAVSRARSGIAWRHCHETNINHFKPQAADPFHEPGEGSLIWQVSTKSGCARADGDFTVLEFRR